MKLFKIKDNEKKNKAEFSDVHRLVRAVSDKTLAELEKEGVFVFPSGIRESDDITRDQMILQSVNDSFCSGNVMGFIGYGDERLIIESRFSKGDNDYFFQYLLERVMNFPNIVNLESDAHHDSRMYSLLLFLFPTVLSVAMRKGPFKAYKRNQYNDGNVRGTIDINRHIRKNTPFIGNIAYNQREYAYDNYLMQLIRHTIEFIKRKPYGQKLLAKVKDEIQLVTDVTPEYSAKNIQKVLIENKKNSIRHAYYHEYRALQQLCILILQDERVMLGVGQRKVYGILFDGAWLWEEYVYTLVKDNFHHPMNKSRKDGQKLFAEGSVLVYPDFIGKDTVHRIIADAKYKPVENIGNKDYLQVLAYMFRFDSKKAYYLYPDVRNDGDVILRLNKGISYEDNVTARHDTILIKHGLVIPQGASSYSDFKDQISRSEKLFKMMDFAV